MTLFPGATVFPSSILYPSSGLDTRQFIFRTPIVQRRMPVIPPVMALMNFALAVVRIQGQWFELEVVTQDQIDAAEYFFPGGYEHVVDAATAAILTDAGYTVEPITPPSSAAVVGSAIVGTSTAA